MPTFFGRVKSAASAVKSAVKSAVHADPKKRLEEDVRLKKAAWKNEKNYQKKGNKRTAYYSAEKRLDDFNAKYQDVPLTKEQIENKTVSKNERLVSENERLWHVYLRNHYKIINKIIKEKSNSDTFDKSKQKIKRLIKFQYLIDNPILMLNIDNIGLSVLEADEKAAKEYIRNFLEENNFTTEDITNALQKFDEPVLKNVKQQVKDKCEKQKNKKIVEVNQKYEQKIETPSPVKYQGVPLRL